MPSGVFRGTPRVFDDLSLAYLPRSCGLLLLLLAASCGGSDDAVRVLTAGHVFRI